MSNKESDKEPIVAIEDNDPLNKPLRAAIGMMADAIGKQAFQDPAVLALFASTKQVQSDPGKEIYNGRLPGYMGKFVRVCENEVIWSDPNTQVVRTVVPATDLEKFLIELLGTILEPNQHQ